MSLADGAAIASLDSISHTKSKLSTPRFRFQSSPVSCRRRGGGKGRRRRRRRRRRTRAQTHTHTHKLHTLALAFSPPLPLCARPKASHTPYTTDTRTHTHTRARAHTHTHTQGESIPKLHLSHLSRGPLFEALHRCNASDSGHNGCHNGSKSTRRGATRAEHVWAQEGVGGAQTARDSVVLAGCLLLQTVRACVMLCRVYLHSVCIFLSVCLSICACVRA